MSEQTKQPITWGGFRRFARRYSRWKTLVAFEEFLSSFIASRLGRWRLVPALEYFGKLGLLTGAILWICPGACQRQQTAEDARRTKHFTAWQTLNSAVGKPGNAGRAEAIQTLVRDAVSLCEIDLTDAALPEGARLAQADLRGAKFTRTRLVKADLKGANLAGAELFETDVTQADFSEANLLGANVAQMKGWTTIRSLRKANVFGVITPPDGFLEWATNKMGAVSVPVGNFKEWQAWLAQHPK